MIQKITDFYFASLLALFIMGCGSTQEKVSSPLLVAAASDLAKVSGRLAAAFEPTQARKVTFSLGASGQLEGQIRQGAPFDVFAPAARSFCESLEQDGFLAGSCAVYARGRLVVWSQTLELDSLDELRQSHIRQIAIANPQFAPYGRAAQQALQSAGLWDVIQPKLILAESVAHAFQMAGSGNVEVALVALALVKDAGRPFYLVSQQLHQPIEQAAAVLRESKNQEAASRFVAFLTSPEGRRILQDYGFEIPDDTSAPR